MHSLSLRVQKGMEATARQLSGQLREHAATRGVDPAIFPYIQVHYDHGGFRAGTDPEHQQAFDGNEWGSLDRPPTAFARTFEPALEQAWRDTFDAALRAHLAEAR